MTNITRMHAFIHRFEDLSEKPEKLYTRPALKKCFLRHSGLPEWLLTRCQKEGADFAETLARCWPQEGPGLGTSLENFIRDSYPTLTDPEALIQVWNQCTTQERIVVNRLLIGFVPETKTEAVIDPELPRKEIQAEFMYALLSGDPEYSFGLYQGKEPVVFTRVTVQDPQLTAQLQAYLDQHTTEKKGPVRIVSPGLVGKISYTGFTVSARHKSGIKVEHPQLESLFPPGGLWQAQAFTDL
ncbi:hypothetical protein P3T73_01350 [Kiritimatiellota bacterium B12222]|nr:hypothetical protein P3T73_01350 [Kiritimatiellota bacterium B12222]